MKRFDVITSGLSCFLIIFALHGLVAMRRGPLYSPDARVYVNWADLVSANGFSYAPVMGTEGVTSPRLFRALFVYYLAIVRLAGGNHWAALFVFLNVVWEALAGTMLVRLIRKTTGRPAAALVALIAYVFAFDILAWTPYILSDTIYLISTVAVFVLMCRVATSAPTWRDIALLAFALFIALNLRPTGIVLIPLALIALFIGLRTQGRIRPFTTTALVSAGIVAIAGCALLFIVDGWILQKPSRWPASFMVKAVRMYSEESGRGEVVKDRQETYLTPPTSVVEYAAVCADRMARFLQFTASGYSLRHNLTNSAYCVPLYLLALIGLIHGWRAGNSVQVAVTLALLWIAAHALFHALTELDFDWRYRVPAIPQLIFLAGVGVGALSGAWTRSKGDSGSAAAPAG